jgi:DNA-directed RNA polymerase specialized sigma24 family protein
MLELLAKDHDVWVRMVVSFGEHKVVAEDIVQSFYIRMHKYIKDESKIMYSTDEVNRFFVYVTLKNMWKTYKKSMGRYDFYEVWDEEAVDDSVDHAVHEGMNNAFDKILHDVREEMGNWHRYDRLLSEKYFKSDYSLREIAKGTGISLTSIFNTIKNNKRILKDKFGEDYEDFKNGDYNLI